ncbi:MAG: glycosyltransferase [Longimicrobiales bacterium]|nr:glycosyltransferase [Longimicrobiales bacterium]
MSPVVSVLLPVRDGGRQLETALDSLARQTLEEIEVVVVDDGSDDDTPAVLERWASRDPRFRVFRQPPSGIVEALERARSEARGRYLARMDADDVSTPERLERQLRLMDSDPGLAGCGTRVEYVPRDVLKEGARRYERWINGLVTPEAIAADIFVECPLPHPTFFLRADAVEEVGGYRDRGWPEDYDLVLRLWEAGHRLGKVPEVLLRWREGPDRLSRMADAYSRAAFRRCKVHFLRRTLLAGRPGAVIWGAGPTGKAFGRELLGQGGEILAWVDLDPRKVGQEIHGAPVVGASRVADLVEERSEAVHLGAVAQVGARREIRAAAEELGLRELVDFAVVA